MCDYCTNTTDDTFVRIDTGLCVDCQSTHYGSEG